MNFLCKIGCNCRSWVYDRSVRTLFGTTGKRIKVLRSDLDMSQADLARSASMYGQPISQSTLSRYEADETAPPSDVLALIARALGTTADYLVLLSDDPLPPGESFAVAERQAEYTSDAERALLDVWRSLGEQDRDILMTMARRLHEARPRIIGE